MSSDHPPHRRVSRSLGDDKVWVGRGYKKTAPELLQEEPTYGSNWVFKYTPDKPIFEPCINPSCKSNGENVFKFYATYGEDFNGPGHVLECSICGHVQREGEP